MRKNLIIKLLTIVMIVTFLSGCSSPNTTVKVPDDLSTESDIDQGNDTDVNDVVTEIPDEGTVIQGITVNQIAFEVVDVNTLSEQMKADIDTLKLQRGYEYWQQEDGSYLIMISAGEKRTGGYGIEVCSVEDNEGKTVISVIETEPSPDAMVTEALTYPFVVIKASGITDRFVISDQNGNEYLRIKVE